MNRLLYLLGKNNFINDVPVACVPATGTKKPTRLKAMRDTATRVKKMFSPAALVSAVHKTH